MKCCDVSVIHISISVRPAFALIPCGQLSTSQPQLAVIGTLPWLSWERSKSAYGHRQAAPPSIRELSFHGAGAQGRIPPSHLLS